MLIDNRLFPTYGLVLVAALMFVYCGDSDEPTEPVNPLAGAALCLSDDICGVCPEGDSSTVIEVTNCGNSTVLNWTATETSDWFSLSAGSGTTPGSFTVEADTNKTTAARTGQVIVTAEGLADAAETLSVAQPLYGSILHVSIEDWTAAAACDTSEAVNVTNCGNASVLSWSAESESSWLTMVPSEGDTPGEFEIIADSNLTGAERTGTVTVSAAGLTDEPAAIAVTQPMPEPALSVSVSEWQPSSLGDETEILVTNSGNDASISWVVTEDKDWLTLSAAGGSTPGSFTITADANETENSRAGLVTVTADGIAGSPWVITVEQPPHFTLVGYYDTEAYAGKVYVSGDYAYVADAWSLQIIDISDCTSPVLAGSYPATSSSIAMVYVSGQYAYVGDFVAGFMIIDVSDPTNPTLVGSCATADKPHDVFISGDYAYVADYEGGLQVIDISDPTDPAAAGSYDTPDVSYGVYVSGDYAYVADRESGLQIIGISDPTDPVSAGEFIISSANGVFVSSGYAYLACYYNGLQIIDVSEPSNPVLAGSYDTPDRANRVKVSGDYAYVADRESGLLMIDVTDPTDPALIGSYDTPNLTMDVFLAGGYAYVADREGGLLILKLGF